MKILMLSWEYPPRIVGGISRVVYDLAHSIAKKGHEVHVVTLLDQGAPEYEEQNNVFVHRICPYEVGTNNFIDWVLQMNFALTEKAIQVMNKEKIDIIHAHDWVVAFAARSLKMAYNVPLISTIHATEHGRNNGIHNEMQSYIHSVEWWLTYESWKVICNSHYMKNEIQNIFQLPYDKTTVINNGVDLEKFNKVDRDWDFRRNFANDNEKIVFFVGRLVQEKGVQVLIDAAPKIAEYYNDVKFVIAGKGPQFDYLKHKVDSLGIGHKFYFTGYISDENLLKLYKCADIAAFPSLYEPFGIVALEAMVAGAALVVADTCGLGEIVHHGVDGMKAYTGNANSLADCILELLHNQENTENMRRNAKLKVQNMYNWDKISDETLYAYQEILGTQPVEKKEVKKEVKKTVKKEVKETVKKESKKDTTKKVEPKQDKKQAKQEVEVKIEKKKAVKKA